MSLTNIEYGSIASSDILNKNFSLLNNKISANNDAISAELSSVLSNIASINLKLNELSDEISDTHFTLISQINDLKNRIQNVVNEVNLLPDWSEILSIEKLTNFNVESNGYLYLVPQNDNASVDINGALIDILAPIFIPVKTGDVINSTSEWNTISFLPIYNVLFDRNQ